jgi:hypothetical protein
MNEMSQEGIVKLDHQDFNDYMRNYYDSKDE